MSLYDQFITPYGSVNKVDAYGYFDALRKHPEEPRKHGRVVMVTADTPWKASRGEGKTTATIALVDALRARGVDAAGVLRQPSMGITAAGSKGGASGGGKSSLAHPEIVDWGLCGEMSAIAAAQNLLVAFAEKAVDEGRLDTIAVPRVSETPSRSLRRIIVDRGGNSIPERVVLTPTCELTQILVLSRSMAEISERVASMVAGSKDGKPVVFGEFVDLWRISGILFDAVKPALTETKQGSPMYVHCGPFANVSIGIPSLISVELACAQHDVVVVEAGYGADAGAQKWLDVACREYGAPWPAAAVVVTRATTWRANASLAWRFPHHVRRLEGLGIPSYPLINLWAGEDDQVTDLRADVGKLGFRAPIVANLFRDGGSPLTSQLSELIATVTAAGPAPKLQSHKGRDFGKEVRWIISTAYGVPPERVIERKGFAESLAQAREECRAIGTDLDDLSVIAVKSPATMTDDDSKPESERTVTLKKVVVHAGARIVQVNLTSTLTTPMPKIV